MKKIDIAEIQENAPKGWYIRRKKDIVEAYRILNGKDIRVLLRVLPGNRMEFLHGIPRYLKVDTQAQLCGKQMQYIPTHNCKNIESTQNLFNRTGLIDHLLDPDWISVNPTYKGGKDLEEREELLDEVNRKGLNKEDE